MTLAALLSFEHDSPVELGPAEPRTLFFCGYYWDERTGLISKTKGGNCCGLRADNQDEFYRLAEHYRDS